MLARGRAKEKPIAPVPHARAFAYCQKPHLAKRGGHGTKAGEVNHNRTRPMLLKPLSLALATLIAAPAYADAAATDASVAGQTAEAAEAPAKKPLFAFLAPKSDAEKAARRAEREAARAAKKSNTAQDLAAQETENARAEVKVAVAEAIENRPKGRIWCVPFARAVSGVTIKGNAKTWWAQAKGLYPRGHEPQVGAVMAFAASRAMPKGHVAVVSKLLSEREILIDHANWERNRITEDTLVVDVSTKGDWSAVKVANANGTFGRVNPINGFIYN